MRDMQRQYTQDTQDAAWSQDSPIHVSPEAFDALSRILARKIAQGVPTHTPGPQPNPLDAADGQHSHSEHARQAPYEWSARYLLNKMRIETA